MDKNTKDRNLTGLRKRQQIQGTNKQIFIWVAVAAVIVSFCLVGLQLIGREFFFNLKIIEAKQEAADTLAKNLDTAKELKTNVDALISSTNLSAVKREDSEASNLTVILDALPTRGDATGFADSMQNVILPPSGVAIRELSTNQERADIDEDVTDASEPLELPFNATFGGDAEQIKEALKDMARVIRPIQPQELTIRASDNILTVSVDGVTYYLPASSVEVEKRTLKP